jgi:small subunit ribosomal protein S7
VKRFAVAFTGSLMVEVTRPIVFGLYAILDRFYTKFSLYTFFKKFVETSRLRVKLQRRGMQFREEKRITRKDTRTFEGDLHLFSLLYRSLIKRGRRNLALTYVGKFILLLKFKSNNNKYFVDKYVQMLETVRPMLNYKPMYIGGKKYQIPVLMPVEKSYFFATRWFIKNSLDGTELIPSMFNNLEGSLRNEGRVVKFRENFHALAFENKSYTRFLKFLKKGIFNMVTLI